MLTPAQRKEVIQELISVGAPVRFLKDGRALDIQTGDMAPRGTNVMYHPVYWNFTRATSRKVAQWLGARAVFSK